MKKTATITLEDGQQVNDEVEYRYIKNNEYAHDYILDDYNSDEFEILSITNPDYQGIIDSDFDEFKNEVSEQI